ncbi:methyltransferase domain-containing protein [Novosphingobium huizhouense]|uniref:hypothetical protein n=1 Tax=Novosphingobium huizhouense TaxID=2866625 RepID=UPI001CD89C2E|nr:hypothetical protein [Novosphingobium huizhouense]
MRGAQNCSTAVMQRRLRDDVPDQLDYFPTPPWATRALCEFLIERCSEPLDMFRAWEPACGEGHMARPLAEYFESVTATDVYRYGDDHGIYDFLGDAPRYCEADWIITNPPYNVGARFVEKALTRARRGVAMFVRSAFTEGESRYPDLFAPPVAPAYVLTFSERVPLLKGRLIRKGAPDPFNLDEDGKPRKVSSATSYAWIVWMPGCHDTRHRWIAPGTFKRLDRPGDYPAYALPLSTAMEGSLL